jgi:twitching motility two-component system response regulator PilG
MKNLALVIEDEQSLRTIYQMILSEAGYEVIEAQDGEEALAMLAEVAPDVVFLDILLPRVDGTQILTYMRTAPHLQDTNIVIVTAHNRFRQANCVYPTDTFLLKPVRPHDLLDAVKRATTV